MVSIFCCTTDTMRLVYALTYIIQCWMNSNLFPSHSTQNNKLCLFYMVSIVSIHKTFPNHSSHHRAHTHPWLFHSITIQMKRREKNTHTNFQNIDKKWIAFPFSRAGQSDLLYTDIFSYRKNLGKMLLYNVIYSYKYTKPERSLAHVPIMTFIAPINLYITFEGLNCADCANNEKHL